MKKSQKEILKKVLFLILLIVVYQVYIHYFESPVNSSQVELRQDIQTTEIPTIQEIEKSDFQIYFLDVGQADAILIQNNGEYALVDAGGNQDGDRLVRIFHELGIQNFQYVIGTHAHADHVGGMDSIIKNFSIEHFFMPDVVTTTRTFEDILDALEEKKVSFETPSIDDTFSMADTKFQVLWVGNDKDDLNNTSIVLKVIYHDTSFLLTGDATSTVEKEILSHDLKSDVLKVGHHGSQYSSSAQFLRAVDPDVAVISVGKDNEYGHPKDVVLQKLERLGTKVYRTDLDGTIIASSDGERLSFQTIHLNGE